MKIDTLHEKVYNLVNTITDFNIGYKERPKELIDEKMPAFAVYFEGHKNNIETTKSNRRTYNMTIDVIYDKKTIDTTQTVTSDLVSKVIDTLEKRSNTTLDGEACYTLPTTAKRLEEYVVAGKIYLAYQITYPIITIETI